MGVKTRLLASGKTEDNEFNISLLGFKMAVNEGLTVFNLVDGIVDEFHDESGTDEAEGSNDAYEGGGDYYINNTSPTATATTAKSAGFSLTAVTEPDTSSAGSNPTFGSGTFGEYTVPSDATSLNLFLWGAAGGGGDHSGSGSTCEAVGGGGGGFATGILSVTAGQKLEVVAGEGGAGDENPGAPIAAFPGGGFNCAPGTAGSADAGTGGGLTAVFAEGAGISSSSSGRCNPTSLAPSIYMVAGSGGGGGGHHPNGTGPIFANRAYWFGATAFGGGGGGTTGNTGGTDRAQTNSIVAGGTGGPSTSPVSIPATYGHYLGGGGDQEQGGQGAPSTNGGAEDGGFLYGGKFCGPDVNVGAGGAGFNGGGDGGYTPQPNSGFRGGGGGSSYIGNPQISSGSTEAADAFAESGGVANPLYPGIGNVGEGMGNTGCGPVQGVAEDGYVFLTVTGVSAAATSSTIISNAFTANSVPTTSRIVVFEENVDTPTLNTDIIASISRDGGSTFTTATLSDSGYVTGSSGQRILTGQATISGQPSGQSMRWKLALANNAVKIHGVSLQWS